MYCGVDEAGRGSAMGPLVVGVVYIEDDEVLKDIGVKDSKKLTPKARERMYDEIAGTVPHWCTVIASASDIDEQRKSISLNEIELNMFAEGTTRWASETIYADCPDINEAAFSAKLSAKVGNDVGIIAKHKADDTYPIVSAASIIAKVTRDRMMEDICRELGIEPVSGYPGDHYTMEFIQKWIDDKGKAPPYVRTSWEPVREMLSRKKTRKLDEW
jgi:ribonuclease HII